VAEVAIASNDAATAATAAAAAIAADPAAWSAQYALAEAELLRGDSAAALRTIEALLERWPDNGRALYLRGAALLGVGHTDEGARVLTLAQKRLASSPVYLARIEQLLR
jgi:Flp pilus assembly protein TadD